VLFFRVLLYSVIVFIVIPSPPAPPAAGWIGRRGTDWFERRSCRLCPGHHHGIAGHAGFIFAFQADNITNRFFHVVLIAVPITLQVYFNASLVYG